MARAKRKVVYECSHCGHQAWKWMGRCPECGHWGSLSEDAAPVNGTAAAATAHSLAKIAPEPAKQRWETGLGEFDRVLGGGLVPGSAVLLGGAPGIGKSTLLLQAAGALASDDRPILYVSAEESVRQIKLRAERTGVNSECLYVCAETSVDAVLRAADKLQPSVIIVDSLQTVTDSTVESAAGTVSQVRQCAGRLTTYAKGEGIGLFLVGHVTKDGSIAGPRVVEHLVDTVLYFEETNGQPFRLLRAYKNRFGSTHELGVFEMSNRGLCVVENPSALFLSERPIDVPGSVVAVALEGTRPLLVEVQALATKTHAEVPRRAAVGFDPNRAALLTAVLERKVQLRMSELDIYLNVAGGVRLREPAADLPVVMALASSILEIPMDPNTAVFGELGLTGELRAVSQTEVRIKEAAKLGFKRVIVPAGAKQRKGEGLEVTGVATLREAVDAALVPRAK